MQRDCCFNLCLGVIKKREAEVLSSFTTHTIALSTDLSQY